MIKLLMMTLPILVSHILRHGVFEWGRPHVPHTTRGEVRHYFMSQGFKKMNMIKSQTSSLNLVASVILGLVWTGQGFMVRKLLVR